MSVLAPDLLRIAEQEQYRRAYRRKKAFEHPAFLIQFMECIDAKTGERFDFDLLTYEERAEIDLDGGPGKWFWHRAVLESWMEQEVSLEYKARQIGVTWLASAYGLALCLTHPGLRFLVISINLEEAQKVISRIWGMYNSLPAYFTSHMTLTKPSRGGAPSQEIEWMDEQGRRSSILALPSTPKAGHGETAGLVLLDEQARQDYARESWKAAFPVIDGGGKAIIVSTANGVSTEDGEGEAQGNFFHYLWTNADSMGIDKRFLGVFTHPDRNEEWYREKARRLPASDRAEMYPRTPEEGFIGTGQCWFDLDQLNWYRGAVAREGSQGAVPDDVRGDVQARRADREEVGRVARLRGAARRREVRDRRRPRDRQRQRLLLRARHRLEQRQVGRGVSRQDRRRTCSQRSCTTRAAGTTTR